MEHNIVVMITSAGPVAKAVLVVLLMMSVVCWGIMISKAISFSKVRKEGEKFRNLFDKSANLTHLYNEAGDYTETPFAAIYSAGYRELQKSVKKSRDDGGQKSISLITFHAIERSLEKAASEEIIRLERKLNFLATTGNTAPFIGLFGTVWGVMDAFRIIGVKGSASIGGVAPGISEALIATAAGLAAAVPAVIGYNTYVNKVRRYEKEVDSFIADFLIVVEKNFNVE